VYQKRALQHHLGLSARYPSGKARKGEG
jgi:hypothetical protein